MKKNNKYLVERINDKYDVELEYEFMSLEEAELKYNELAEDMNQEYQKGQYNSFISLTEINEEETEELHSTLFILQQLKSKSYQYLFIYEGLIDDLSVKIEKEKFYDKYEEFDSDEDEFNIGYFIYNNCIYLTTKEAYIKVMDNDIRFNEMEYHEFLLDNQELKSKIEIKI